jgi:hypothetical protein
MAWSCKVVNGRTILRAAIGLSMAGYPSNHRILGGIA